MSWETDASFLACFTYSSRRWARTTSRKSAWQRRQVSLKACEARQTGQRNVGLSCIENQIFQLGSQGGHGSGIVHRHRGFQILADRLQIDSVLPVD